MEILFAIILGSAALYFAFACAVQRLIIANLRAQLPKRDASGRFVGANAREIAERKAAKTAELRAEAGR